MVLKKEVKYNSSKWWEWFLFGFSDAATNSVYLVMMMLFMLFCTDFYGISAGVAGTIMMGTRLLDAFTDPIIGMMVDRTNTRFGRFRPWIIFGSLILNVTFFFLFLFLCSFTYYYDHQLY